MEALPFFKIELPADAEQREKALVNLSWILRGFASSISHSYIRNAPRVLEADSLIVTLLKELRSTLTDSEFEELANGLLISSDQSKTLLRAN